MTYGRLVIINYYHPMRVNINQNRTRKKVLHLGPYNQNVFNTALFLHHFRSSILRYRKIIFCVSVGESCA
jgi:hypothetical protein